MRFVLLGAALVASTGFFACGDDEAGTDTDGNDAGVADTGAPQMDGGKRAPSGCLLESTGFRSGFKSDNVARSDVANAANWTDVDNAREADGKFASITLEDGQESATLRVSDFGFALPAGAETWGVEVELRRQSPDAGVADSRIDIEIANKTTDYKRMEVPWPSSAMGTHAYGQAIDTWGADINPSDFNRSDFAAKLSVKRADGAVGPVSGVVDSLRVAVHYCPDPSAK